MSWSFSSAGGPGYEPDNDQLEHLLGPHLLEWVTGRTYWRNLPDGDPAHEVLAELKEIVQRSTRSSAETLYNFELELSQMGPSGLSRLVELHMRANPANAGPGTFSDPLATVAFISALSALPRALMPPEAMTLGFGGASVGFNLVHLVADDQELNEVFGKISEDEAGVYGLVAEAHWSTNSGTLQLGSALNALGEYALDLALLEGAPTLSELGIASRRAAVLARDLLRGKKIAAQLIVNFTGIELDGPLALKDGVVYPATGWARHLRAAHPSASAIGVLTTDFWLNEIHRPSEFGENEFFTNAVKFRRRNLRSSELIDEKVLRLRLSLLVSSQGSEVIAPFPFSTELSTPLQSRHRMNIPVRSWGSGVHTRIQVTGRTWRRNDYTSRSRRLPKHLHMAVRRLLSAAADREDPADGFVDAIVAWEAMVGGESAVSFRVCAAMALLVDAENGTSNAASFEELRRLYDLRSRVVHGSAVLKEDAADLRQRAVEFGLTALRALMRTPGLLIKESAETRNKAILLRRVEIEPRGTQT